jgi:hypothetical protein
MTSPLAVHVLAAVIIAPVVLEIAGIVVVARPDANDGAAVFNVLFIEASVLLRNAVSN